MRNGYSWRWNHIDREKPGILILHSPDFAGTVSEVSRLLPEDFPLSWAGSSPWLEQLQGYAPFPSGSAERTDLLREVLQYGFAGIFLLGDGRADLELLRKQSVPLIWWGPDAPEGIASRNDASPEALAREALALWENAAPSPHPERAVREPAEWSNYSLDEDGAGPRILLVGDSICNGYEEAVRRELEGFCRVDALQTSEGSADGRLERLLDFLTERREYQLIHLNNGIHLHGVSVDEYQANLRRILTHLQRKAPLAFATTTPIHQAEHPDRLDEAEMERFAACNRAAKEICGKMGIPVDDLWELALQEGLAKRDAFHFLPEGSLRLARQVSGFVRARL